MADSISWPRSGKPEIALDAKWSDRPPKLKWQGSTHLGSRLRCALSPIAEARMVATFGERPPRPASHRWGRPRRVPRKMVYISGSRYVRRSRGEFFRLATWASRRPHLGAGRA